MLTTATASKIALSTLLFLAECGTSGVEGENPGTGGSVDGGISGGAGGANGGTAGVGGSSGGLAGAPGGAGSGGGSGGSAGSSDAQLLPRKRRIAVGDNSQVCAVTQGRTIACWGVQGLIDPPPEEDATFDAVAASANHICGRRLDGTATCWHDAETSPVGVIGDFSLGGDGFGCALTVVEGALECWTDFGPGYIPMGAPQTPFVEIDAGAEAACARDAAGSLTCWGNNDDGRATPPAGAFAQFGFGSSHGCAISGTGMSTCWGFGTDFRSPPAGTVLRQVAAGPVGTCGILADGTVDCWADLNEPALLEPPSGQFVEVAVGANNACAVRSDGDAICWPEIGGIPQPQGLKVRLD